MNNKQNKLLDAFGTPINVGDIVMGAKARPSKAYYQDTEYTFSVVIARTKQLIRLHKLGWSPKHINVSKEDILTEVADRKGKRGGAIPPLNVINIGKPTGISQEEFDTALNSRVGEEIDPNNAFII